MKLMKILSVLSILFIIGCNNTNQVSSNNEGYTEEKEEQLKVYTTLYPIKDFASKVGGEHVDVESILPAGGNPHTFEPTAKMMVRIAKADAFIYNGAGLESYAKQISESLDNENVKIVEAANDIELLNYSESVHNHKGGRKEHKEGEESHSHEEEHKEGEESHSHEEEHKEGEESHSHEEEHKKGGESHSHEEEHKEGEEDDSHEHGDYDPHLWLDPMRSIELANNIKETLIELKPEAKEDFENNFEELKDNLKKLDEEFQQTLSHKEMNKILVSHAAYGYWEERYGIEQIAISGLSPTNQPSQKELERIIKESKKHNLNYVLFEQNVTTKVSEVIKNEIGAEALRLHNISVLTSEEKESEEDYFSLMRRNLEVLNKALSK